MNTIREMELEQTRFILQIISWIYFKYLFYVTCILSISCNKHPRSNNETIHRNKTLSKHRYLLTKFERITEYRFILSQNCKIKKKKNDTIKERKIL